MPTLKTRDLLLLAALALGPAHAAEGTAAPADSPDMPAQAAFDRLKGLEGAWTGRFADGRTHTVDYRLSAGGTVLVETWQLAPGRESMTLYHLDGDRLLATHYCPQGNQPRLAWVPGPDASVLSFEFVDGTGLQRADGWHQHAFTTVLTADGGYTRSETYVENSRNAPAPDAEVDPPIVYTRSGPAE